MKETVLTATGIRALLQEENARIRETHFSGAGGSEIVQRRTALIDRTLRDLHRSISAEGPLPAVVAIGGYGRGELNPYSDIDILLLCRDEEERKQAPRLLYALWDAGLDIGYSVRTIGECVDLARKDLKIRTSLLESRLLAGDDAHFGRYQGQMASEVFHYRSRDFVAEKIAERNSVRQKYGGSLFLREPNIKESAGGLRDLHTALWLAFTHFRIRSFPELVSQGVLTARNLAVLLRSRNFLWRLRNELHYLSGRKNDHLTFDLQETAARDFRYRDSRDLEAVERFMKSYFIHARNVLEISSAVTGSVLPPPRKSWFDRSMTVGVFTVTGKLLFPRAEEDVRDRPDRIMEAFHIFQERHAVFSPTLQRLVASCRVSDADRRSPDVARVFLAILDRPDRLAETLTVMKETRFLGTYLPEFRAIQALGRRDYFHVYTVDEHILHAVGNLERLWQGRHPAPSMLNEAAAAVRRRWILVLAVLLHDLGKVFRSDHEARGRAVAEGVLDRMGVQGADRERVLLLVEQHLTMSTLSQRRELTDHNVVGGFARMVRDRENLAMLYVLTYADMASVSATTWTPWRASLLEDLYLRTLRYFEHGRVTDEEMRQRAAAGIAKLKKAAAGRFGEEKVDAFVKAMPPHYLQSASTERMLRHLAMTERLLAEGLIIDHRQRRDRGYTEVTVCAYDAYGMFYRTAGAISAQNLNILRAQVYTGKNGIMIDTFQVSAADGGMVPYEEVWQALTTDLRMVLSGSRRPSEAPMYVRAREGSPAVPTEVEFDNETSETLTIIDITARDRVGLLYLITRTLYELNLDIASAKIATEGTRALDTFYVSDLLRNKITDPVRQERIRNALITALDTPTGAAGAGTMPPR